jgi:hypothetical protein
VRRCKRCCGGRRSLCLERYGQKGVMKREIGLLMWRTNKQNSKRPYGLFNYATLYLPTNTLSSLLIWTTLDGFLLTLLVAGIAEDKGEETKTAMGIHRTTIPTKIDPPIIEGHGNARRFTFQSKTAQNLSLWKSSECQGRPSSRPIRFNLNSSAKSCRICVPFFANPHFRA